MDIYARMNEFGKKIVSLIYDKHVLDLASSERSDILWLSKLAKVRSYTGVSLDIPKEYMRHPEFGQDDFVMIRQEMLEYLLKKKKASQQVICTFGIEPLKGKWSDSSDYFHRLADEIMFVLEPGGIVIDGSRDCSNISLYESLFRSMLKNNSRPVLATSQNGLITIFQKSLNS